MNMSSDDSQTQQNPVHILIIPFPAPGHLIPLIDLTRRLLHRHSHLTVTFFITPSSLPLLEPLLAAFPSPQLQPLILSPPPISPPSSKESKPPTRKIRAIHLLSDPIISWCESQPSPPTVIISDFFCSWTHTLSSHLNIPRIVFYSSGAFGSAVFNSIWRLKSNINLTNDPNLEVVLDDVYGSPKFKWSELSTLFTSGKHGDPDWDIFQADMLTNQTSWGAVFNTFSELENVYIDQFKKEMGDNRVWAVGPLLPDEADDPNPDGTKFQEVMEWLDRKSDCSVVYICFGSRTSLTTEESSVLRAALKYSKVCFVWCVRELDGGVGWHINTTDSELDPDTAENGLVIKGWAPQAAILKHRAVGGFVTHCGWNSIIESIWSGVVMVAWPMGADQYSNAQLVVDQLGLGFRVKCAGPNNVPDPQELGQLLSDSVRMTRLERVQVMSLGKVAASTVKSGSSATDFDQFVRCLSECSL